MITLTPLNRREAVRYLGGAGVQMNAEMERLMDVCEAQLRGAAQPKVVWKRIDLPCEELTAGEDIVRHLSGCTQAVLLGATLGAAVDRLIRVAQIRDMAQAVVLDSMASVAVEQVCTQADALLARQFPDMYMTFRRHRTLFAHACQVGDGDRRTVPRAHRKTAARLRGMQPAHDLSIQKER